MAENILKQQKTATLLITCPDSKGIIAQISYFLFKNNGNILHSDQHQDFERSLFLMRIEWELNGFSISKD